MFYTIGTISSLLSTTSSPAASIKPLLVSRSSTQNSTGYMNTKDLTNSSVERIQLISWLQNGASYKVPDCTVRRCPSWHDLERHYFWHFTPAQIAQHEAQTWQSSDLKCPVWNKIYTNEHFYVRGIIHHKIGSVISNVSLTAHQLLTTRHMAKMKGITTMPTSRKNNSLNNWSS